jgi:hypothetical protein
LKLANEVRTPAGEPYDEAKSNCEIPRPAIVFLTFSS